MRSGRRSLKISRKLKKVLFCLFAIRVVDELFVHLFWRTAAPASPVVLVLPGGHVLVFIVVRIGSFSCGCRGPCLCRRAGLVVPVVPRVVVIHTPVVVLLLLPGLLLLRFFSHRYQLSYGPDP